MSYSNIDKSQTFAIECSTYADMMINTCRTISDYLETILTQDFGFIRADEKGDRSGFEPTSAQLGWGRASYHYINIYKKEANADNFLICDVTFLFDGSDYGVNILSKGTGFNRDTIEVGTRITFAYSRENLNDIFVNNVDTTLNNTAYSTIDGLYINSPFLTYRPRTEGSSEDPRYQITYLPLREISTSSSKFLTVTDDYNSFPAIGYMTVNNTIIPIINKTVDINTSVISGAYPPDPTGAFTWNEKYPEVNANISNTLFIRGQDHRRGLNNFFSEYEFRNNKNKMPILPIYLTHLDNESTTDYDFDKPIQGYFQTGKDFATSRGSKYVLDNVSYISLGNHYLIEEGPILQQNGGGE